MTFMYRFSSLLSVYSMAMKIAANEQRRALTECQLPTSLGITCLKM